VLLDKDETVLHDTTEKITGSMWEKPQIVITKRQTSPVQIMIDKTPGECGMF